MKESSTMAFMVPETDYFTGLACIECGSTRPDVSGDDTDPCEECGGEMEHDSDECGVYVRLSAPGYMDATDWSGPFPNRFRALRWLVEFHNVHPRTGEPLD